MPAKPDKPPIILDELKLQMDETMHVVLLHLPPPDRSTATEVALRMSFAAVQAKSIRALEAMEDFNNAKMMPEWRPRDPTKPKPSVVRIRNPPMFSKL